MAVSSLLQILLLLLLTTTLVLGKTRVDVCKWAINKMDCKALPIKSLDTSILFPNNVCSELNHHCSNCVTSHETRIQHPTHNTLVRPERFLIHQEADMVGKDISFNCLHRENRKCGCSANISCSGTKEYCDLYPCGIVSSCRCEVQRATTTLIAYHQGFKYSDPTMFSYKVCVFQLAPTTPNTFLSRTLLAYIRGDHQIAQQPEDQPAPDLQEEPVIKFVHPTLIVGKAGILIMRKGGIEGLRHLTKTGPIPVPDEFLFHEGILHALLIDKGGNTHEANFEIEGSHYCPEINCFFCTQAFSYIKCLPPNIQYIIYGTFLIFTSVLLIYVKSIFKLFMRLIKGIIILVYVFYRVCKGSLRFSLVIGAIFGEFVGVQLQQLRARFEQLNQRPLLLSSAVILLLYVASGSESASVPPQTTVSATPVLQNHNQPSTSQNDPMKPPEKHQRHLLMWSDDPTLNVGTSQFKQLLTCNSDSAVSSKEVVCTRTPSGTSCKVSTQAKLTLRNLGFTACLSITDTQGEHLFDLELSYVNMYCDWSTTRLYYTFPVTLHTIPSVACPQNKYCGWGAHCHRDYKFAGLTSESTSWPGITDCIAGDSGSICTLVDSQPCLFYRWYLIPDYEQTYEVKQLNGYNCYPIIMISITDRNGSYVAKLHKTGSYFHGPQLEITPEGTYDQPVELATRKLIQRLNHPAIAFLDNVANEGRPKYGEVGDVQANASYSKDFIFDEKMVKCSFYEQDLTCRKTNSYLDTLKTSGLELPKTHHQQRFYIETNGQLRSEALTSSALVLHLTLKDFEFKMMTTVICPKIIEVTKVVGCYTCETPALIYITAQSTCEAGYVLVELSKVLRITPIFYLKITKTQGTIAIKSETKCFQDTLCLVYKQHKDCKFLDFCLAEPKIHLIPINITEISSVAKDSPGLSFWDSVWNPISSFFSGLGSYVMYIVIFAFCVLLLISCCLNLFSKLR